jgi:hypothetical protein
MGWFRSDSLEELVGLDLSYMGNNASAAAQSAMSDNFSDNESNAGTDFDAQSVKRNTRSFTNQNGTDDASWTDAAGAKVEQPRSKK